MKKKFLSSLILVSVSMSMGMPVLAADQNIVGPSPQTGKVPVTGSIEKYVPPTPGEINVSIPTSMAFDVGFNKDKQKAELTSADYTITNNGDSAINVTSEYDITDASGVRFTSPDKVDPKASDLQMALSLNVGKDANPTTPWIQNVQDRSAGNAVNIASKGVEHMQFSSTDQGLANITQHAKDGKLDSEVDVKGNLVLTFNNPQQTVVNIPSLTLRAALNAKLGQAARAPITQAQLQGLTGTLTFINKGIYNIEGLQYCTNITGLNLGMNWVSDLTPLKGLTNLTWLNLGNNGTLTHIDPLKGLTNLTHLDISNDPISDITPLSSLKKLTQLNLTSDSISNVDALKGLTNLTDLNLSLNKISDITPLSSLKNLTSLNISHTNISNIDPLKGLTNLNTLYVNNDKISNIEALKGLSNLKLTDVSSFNGTGQSIVLPDVNSTESSATINNPAVGSDGNPLVPTDISNGGKYNKDNNTITFDNVTKDETVTFKFSEKGKNFDGTVTANIKY